MYFTSQVHICGCQNGGNCTAEGVMNTSSNPLLLLCDCNEGINALFIQATILVICVLKTFSI